MCSQNDERLATVVERAISKRDALCGLYRTCRPRVGRLSGDIPFPNSLMAGIYVSADFIEPKPKKKGVE